MKAILILALAVAAPAATAGGALVLTIDIDSPSTGDLWWVIRASACGPRAQEVVLVGTPILEPEARPLAATGTVGPCSAPWTYEAVVEVVTLDMPLACYRVDLGGRHNDLAVDTASATECRN